MCVCVCVRRVCMCTRMCVRVCTSGEKVSSYQTEINYSPRRKEGILGSTVWLAMYSTPSKTHYGARLHHLHFLVDLRIPTGCLHAKGKCVCKKKNVCVHVHALVWTTLSVPFVRRLNASTPPRNHPVPTSMASVCVCVRVEREREGKGERENERV